MILSCKIGKKNYQIDTAHAINCAIEQQFNSQQPNHFGAEFASKKPLQTDNFIGATTQGGSCNVQSLTLVPHCNGTHSESIGHIIDEEVTIGQILTGLMPCYVISINPIAGDLSQDSYTPPLQKEDKVIDLALLAAQIDTQTLQKVEALLVRTLPNDDSKCSRIYNNSCQPPFFTHQAMQYVANSAIKHLLVDVPSIDKMYDDGLLSNHRIFWNIPAHSRKLDKKSKKTRTITEMIYLPDEVADGLYCLDLQLPAFATDAAPSRPVLYPLVAGENS